MEVFLVRLVSVDLRVRPALHLVHARRDRADQLLRVQTHFLRREALLRLAAWAGFRRVCRLRVELQRREPHLLRARLARRDRLAVLEVVRPHQLGPPAIGLVLVIGICLDIDRARGFDARDDLEPVGLVEHADVLQQPVVDLFDGEPLVEAAVEERAAVDLPQVDLAHHRGELLVAHVVAHYIYMRAGLISP